MPSAGRFFVGVLFLFQMSPTIIFNNILVVRLCQTIGQTSPVKTLKPVSKNVSFLLSLSLLPTGTYPSI